MNDYNKSKGHFEQVTNKYKSVISAMQETFIKEYDSTIKQNTLSNLDSLEDISTITDNKDKLSSLLSTIESEKDYIFSSNNDFENYQQKITKLTESYTNRITALEEAKKKVEEETKRKAEEEANKKAEEEKAKTHYENEYFSVDVPKEWIDCWSVEEEKRGTDGTIYQFNYTPSGESNGGLGKIFVVDATYGLPQNGSVIQEACDLVGYTSNNYAVFKSVEVGAGFFSNAATLTLK